MPTTTRGRILKKNRKTGRFYTIRDTLPPLDMNHNHPTSLPFSVYVPLLIVCARYIPFHSAAILLKASQFISATSHSGRPPKSAECRYLCRLPVVKCDRTGRMTVRDSYGCRVVRALRSFLHALCLHACPTCLYAFLVPLLRWPSSFAPVLCGYVQKDDGRPWYDIDFLGISPE